MIHLVTDYLENSAKEFPNNAGKTDGFLELFFKDDLKKIRTTTLENTMTPQWFQEFKIYIIDINEPFYVKLWDENKVFKTENDNGKPKYYALSMFPYPSGKRLAHNPHRNTVHR